LFADDLAARLAGAGVIGRDVRVFEETTSTNDVAEKLARDGAAEGVVIFAESQSRGRGRLGRQWLSPPRQGLWFSILLRPLLRPQETTQLTVMAATALRRAISHETSLEVKIKWPNDILIGGKKVAGILTEMSAELDRVRHVILGIGVDVNQQAGDFPPELRRSATSLRMECGVAVSRAALAAAALRELDADYERLRAGKFGAVADEWENFCATLGGNVTVQIGDERFHGRAEALDETGALLLRTEHGRLKTIHGGDVLPEKRP
ncbi:MAG: biotin--[acetyl-CoA-carboxylase] ligase, partial [Verrucomicrobia bacterium]|nr:biotin--[acetyl-CoA-carboxylase] ligase [Verrucomicrobiota bacterium]